MLPPFLERGYCPGKACSEVVPFYTGLGSMSPEGDLRPLLFWRKEGECTFIVTKICAQLWLCTCMRVCLDEKV